MQCAKLLFHCLMTSISDDDARANIGPGAELNKCCFWQKSLGVHISLRVQGPLLHLTPPAADTARAFF